jgi:hypothetical protein
VAWTKATRVGPPADCASAAATIDDRGRFHVVAECGGRIRYSGSEPDGTWTTSTFSHPANREDRSPQVAFEGSEVYVAYTRVARVDEGCGGEPFRDVGVYLRRRMLPDGEWSIPERIGEVDDRLDSFRVVEGTVHAIVDAEGGPFYETVQGVNVQRYPIEGAFGGISLRVGSDGRARVAFAAGASLKYGVFNGAHFTVTSIPGSSSGSAPLLVLDAQNHAHVVWQRNNENGGGCVDSPPDPNTGLYYGTDASGSWKSARVTRTVGPASFTVDIRTGRVHMIVGGGRGLWYYTKPSNGDWTAKKISAIPGSSPVLRLDPMTGRLLVVFIGQVGGTNGIYAMTRPGS